MKLGEGNPHSILADPDAWVQFEYKRGAGSAAQLADYAHRRNLLYRLKQEWAVNETITDAEIAAWKYLLKLEKE